MEKKCLFRKLAACSHNGLAVADIVVAIFDAYIDEKNAVWINCDHNETLGK